MVSGRWIRITRPLSANDDDSALAAALADADAADQAKAQRERERERRRRAARDKTKRLPARQNIRLAPEVTIQDGVELYWCRSCCEHKERVAIVCYSCGKGEGPALPSDARAYLRPGALREVRALWGWSQRHVAILWKTHAQSVSLIERGRQRARLWDIRLLAGATRQPLSHTVERLGITHIDRNPSRRRAGDTKQRRPKTRTQTGPPPRPETAA